MIDRLMICCVKQLSVKQRLGCIIGVRVGVATWGGGNTYIKLMSMCMHHRPSKTFKQYVCVENRSGGLCESLVGVGCKENEHINCCFKSLCFEVKCHVPNHDFSALCGPVRCTCQCYMQIYLNLWQLWDGIIVERPLGYPYAIWDQWSFLVTLKRTSSYFLSNITICTL